MRMTARSVLPILATLLAAGCSSTPVSPTTERLAYECVDGARFNATYEADRATLELTGRTERLDRMPSSVGARYSNKTVELWARDDEASVQIDGEFVHRGCLAVR